MEARGQGFEEVFPDHETPIFARDQSFRQDTGIQKLLTVTNILEMVSKHMYAPTAATAGLSCFHHHTHVVANQTPAIPNTSISDKMKAHGESPPVKRSPPRKKRLRDGLSLYLRTGRLVLGSRMGISDKGGVASGGMGLKRIGVKEADEAAPGDAFSLYREAADNGASSSSETSKVIRPFVAAGEMGDPCTDLVI